MFQIYACLVYRHDLFLIAVALSTLALAIFVGWSLLLHARAQSGRTRLAWTLAAGLATGSGAWTAHFIAVLALIVSFPMRYAVSITALSLAIALVSACVGLHVALRGKSAVGQGVGALIIAAGITAMHYTGVLALQFPGTIAWNRGFIVMSVVLVCVFAVASVLLTLRDRAPWHWFAGIGLMVLAVVSLHFTAMTAANFRLGGLTAPHVPGGAVSAHGIAVSVAVVSAVILLLGMLALQLNRAAARRMASEQANMRELADIAVEGLVVCNGTTIVATNSSFLQMTGFEETALRGTALTALLDGADVFSALPGHLENEHLLIAADGERIPVEVVSKPIIYAERPHRVLALRDLRERRKADATIRFLAHHDALTGLVNRTAFNAVLARQLRNHHAGSAPFAILAIDLDRFKNVNDALGHQCGDELLRLVAGRLRDSLRDSDCVARLGGDEFAVLAMAPMSAEQAMILAERTVDVLGEPFNIDGKMASIGASVGVALAPEDGREAAALLRHADLALYRAKAYGRNIAVRFEPTMDAESESRRSLEVDLRFALGHCQLELHYQPLYCVRRQSVTGFEALLRWNHPERGMISPADFIHLAEETGLIGPIGEFVLNEAVMEAASWCDDAYIAVNLSPLQIRHGKLVDTVRAALQRSGLAPNRLELEITESVLLQDSLETIRTLHALRALGVRIAMDDFGTGYSSLHYLRSFPFDRIKIDRSFIKEVLTNDESAAIISAVVALSRRLGIMTTAEGVETDDQLGRIEAEGCDTIQGYLIGRPAPAEDARRLLGEQLRKCAMA